MKVLITTSGVGSRLGDLTEFTNKSLVPVGDKPALAHIIDSYPESMEFVITVGHYGDLVKQFLGLAYPDRQIQIVEVENYSGPGSSLGCSMLAAESLLQEPFIYNAGDTIWGGASLPLDGTNWIGGVRGDDSGLYASFDVAGDHVVAIHPKGTPRSDYLYVGLAFIADFRDFWANLSRLFNELSAPKDLSDVTSISEMLVNGLPVIVNEIPSWLDVGSLEGLRVARSELLPRLPTLEKRDEAIFYLQGRVVKFFSDADVCAARVRRGGLLHPHVPEIEASTKNWYSYRFVEGRALGNRVQPRVFRDLLAWAEKTIWAKKCQEVSRPEFEANLQEFYFRKSENRLQEFEKRSGLSDVTASINGVLVPPVRDLLNFVEDAGILQGMLSTIHGDFILDNVVQTDDGFVGIDWRHSFGRSTGYGDRYYDLAKLNHSLTMNHGQLSTGRFECLFLDEGVWVDIDRKASLVQCEAILRNFLRSNDYDLLQLDVLTPIVWLNMSPLHSHPIDIFLHYYGRYKLANALSGLSTYRGQRMTS